jgi:hypothetical protein
MAAVFAGLAWQLPCLLALPGSCRAYWLCLAVAVLTGFAWQLA